MPKYKKRDPEYTAIQFTGSNIREVMDELGTEFSTIYNHNIKNATDFVLEGFGEELIVRQWDWVMVDEDDLRVWTSPDWFFQREYTPVKRVGRPPKGKK